MTLIANRYRMSGSIGGGGMGEIAQCHDTHLDRAVVLKTLQAGVDARRLLDEQKALNKLRSKHVVQLFDIINVRRPNGDQPALVLEHIDGQDLQVGSFSADRNFLRVLWQISCGLSDIHAAGVIHRDVKPSNIRLDVEGVVKILDFGLSRSAGIDDKTRSLIGTAVFMAPELWGQSTISFSTAIDVYAFGVTSLALLSTNIPPELAQSPPSPVNFNSIAPLLGKLPAEIKLLIHFCLASVPSERPKMSEVAAVLEKHLVQNQHRALVILDGTPHRCDVNHARLKLMAGSLGTVSIEYDGHIFKIIDTTGAVYFNNKTAVVGSEIPASCVITFGAGSNRKFVTFDVSNPEVMA